jgi:hypothetical protein
MDGAEVRRESGAFLLRCGPDERRCLNRPTTADGRTMLLGLRPGRYRVTVAGQAAAVTAEVQALTTTEVVLDL